jgi:hypothetical protein
VGPIGREALPTGLKEDHGLASVPGEATDTRGRG